MARKPAVDTSKRGKFSQELAHLGELICTDYITNLKMTVEAARQASDLALEVIRTYAGGTAIYFAKGHLYAITVTHRRIYRKFTGNNHAQLAQEFDLTVRQIYNIIAMIGQEEFEKKQIKLFE